MACPSCGSELGTDAICSYHTASVGVDRSWSDENRVICDLLHRGKEPARLSLQERSDYAVPVDPQGWAS